MAAILDIERPGKTEDELVLEWRLEQLTNAGYDERAAAELAHRGHVDLHLAVDLLRQGCPPALARRILL